MNLTPTPPSAVKTRRGQQQRGLQQHKKKRAAAGQKKRKKTIAQKKKQPQQETAAALVAPVAPAAPSATKRRRRRSNIIDDDADYDPAEKKIRTGRRRKPKPTFVDVATQTAGAGNAPFVMSHKQLLQMQLNNNLSARQMRGVMAAYNAAAPPGLTMHQPNYRDVAVKWNHMLLQQYHTIRMKDPNDDTHFRAAFPVKMTALLQQLAVIHGRDIRRVHLACDAGRKFLKVVATIQWQDHASSSSTVGDHSRRRVIVLAILPLMKESYDLLTDVFHRIDFPSDIDFIFIGDLKVLNICLGLSTSAASNPCPFCDKIILKSVPVQQQLTSGKLRTYRSIAAHADNYDAKTDLLSVSSCIHPPLDIFKSRPDAAIDTVVGHPGLHYLLAANWLINHIETLRPEIAVDWYERYHFVRPAYFSGDFEGNQIAFLLREQQLHQLHDVLDEVQPLDEAPIASWDVRRSRRLEPSTVEKYFNALRAFANVVRACFGKKLVGNWQLAIRQFRDALMLLNLKRIPTKFHIICAHVESWCFRHSVGLATVTDQWAESIHHDWRQLWERSYLVKDRDCDEYGRQLHRCVAAINGNHLPLDTVSEVSLAETIDSYA